MGPLARVDNHLVEKRFEICTVMFHMLELTKLFAYHLLTDSLFVRLCQF